MNYRNADLNDMELLVESRLEFTYGMRGREIEPSCREYQELQSNCERYFRQAIVQNSCDIILAEENGECRGFEIVMLNASDMGRGFKDIKNGMILDGRS